MLTFCDSDEGGEGLGERGVVGAQGVEGLDVLAQVGLQLDGAGDRDGDLLEVLAQQRVDAQANLAVEDVQDLPV